MEIRTWRVEHLEVYCQPGFAPGVGKSSLPGVCWQAFRKRPTVARDVQAIP
jgi:hypothetical protein